MSPLERLALALHVRAAAIEEVTAAWHAADCPPERAVPLVVICAWCRDFDPKAPENRNASHTICPACVARFEQGATS